jgi:trimeric autotransporter adhesin
MTIEISPFNEALLAEASYADFIDPETGEVYTTTGQIKAALILLGFSETQAADFVLHWRIVDHQPNTTSGFSATLFQSIDLPQRTVMAFRGTEPGDPIRDILDADLAGIVASGLAFNQIIDQYNYVQRLLADLGEPALQARLVGTSFLDLDGIVIDDFRYRIVIDSVEGVGLGQFNEVTQVQTVVGHSLGGHLAVAFTRLFESFGAHAYTVNGAGFPTSLFPGVGFWASHNINAVFSMLGGGSNFNSAYISNMYADLELQLVTQDWAVGLRQQGSHTPVYIEDASILGGTFGHGKEGVTNSLAVYNLFLRLDSRLSGQSALEVLKPIFEAASNDDVWVNQNPEQIFVAGPNASLENVINILCGIFGVHSRITQIDNREALYSVIHELLAAPRFVNSQANFHITSFVGMSASEMAVAARNDIGVLYALVNLNHFALTDNPAFYDGLNANATYDIENYSDEYLIDRAEMLRLRILYNTGALDSNDLISLRDRDYEDWWDTDALGNFDYVSLGNNGENFRLVVDGEGLGNTNIIMFDDGTQNELVGGAGDDRLYGMGGDDRLVGGAGNDRLEGGEGVDQYVVGEGRDTIQDSDGEGRIVWGGDDGFVIRGRDGVGNPASDWIKTNDTTYFDRQNNVVYYLVQNFDGTQTLSISSPTRTNGTGGVRIENFHDGDLGINLGAAPTQPVAQLITDGPDVYGQTALTYGLQHSVNGLAGNDLLSGGGEDDYLAGGAGDDVLIGELGNDILDGGDGNDFFIEGFFAASAIQEPLSPEEELLAQAAFIRGQNWYVTREGSIYTLHYDDVRLGGDFVSPEAESDIVLAGNGNDVAWLGVGNDFADGGDDNDYIQGDQDHDVINGGAGDDLIYGDHPDGYGNEQFVRNGNDVLSGDAGNDTVIGNGGNDAITGGAGNDDLYGDNAERVNGSVSLTDQLTGADHIDAGDGDDIVHGGGGNDFILGGTGNDRIYGDNSIAGQEGLYRNFDGNDEIHGGSGDDTIAGMGGNDVLYGDEGDDIILGDHESIAAANGGDDVIFGGAGKDHIGGNGGNDRIDGGEGDDEIGGNEGNDTLTGGAGNDSIVGHDGNDILDGGLGNDALRGDAGNDIYLINGAWGRDAIYGLDDSDAGQDIIRFGVGITPDSIRVALTVDGVFLYRDADNVLKLEGFIGSNHRIEFANGTVWTAQTLVDNLQQQLRDLGIESDNLAIGGGSNDQITGTIGKDVGYGFSGDDAMAGGVGNDLLFGGDGNDTINGDAGNDSLYGGQGNDTISGGENNDQLFGELGNDNLLGGNGSDYLSGGEGDDILIGGQGNDTLDGGAGIDEYHFAAGFGSDTVLNLDSINSAGDAVVFANDISQSSLIFMRDENDNLIIQVEGTQDVLRLRGFFASNSNISIRFANGSVLQRNQVLDLLIVQGESPNGRNIQGTIGTDRLVGSNNNDIIRGDLGNDSIFGYDGDDIIYGGPENYSDSAITDNDVIYGGNGNDTLYGSQGDDRLDGANGNDQLVGGTGEDILLGGAGNDTLIAGSLVILDGIILTDEGSNDLLDGGSGNDILQGGLGTNIYRFEQGFGHDVINLTGNPAGYGGNAYETAVIGFSYGIAASDIVITRDANNLVITNGNNSVTVNDYYISLVNLSLAFADGSVLTRVQAALLVTSTNTAAGFYVRGTDGSDSLNGGVGHDEIIGFAGNDIMFGGGGDDRLFGDSGNDVLTGGTGNDYLEGGSGSDSYTFNLGDGRDIVSNANRTVSDVDIVRLGTGISRTNLIINQIGQDLSLLIDGSDDALTIQGYFSSNSAAQQIRFADGTLLRTEELWNGANRIEGDTANNSLYGYGGDDFINGGNGNDHLDGGIGDDRLEGGYGIDRVEGGDGNDRIYGDYVFPGSDFGFGGDADSLFGGAGNDLIYGQGGNDSIDGGNGDDFIYAGEGDDHIIGGAGIDDIDGNVGNDRIAGGEGNDSFNGGDGSDTYVFGRGAGNDLLIERGISGYFYSDVSINDIDTIELDSSVTPDDVYFVRPNDSHDTVILRIRGTDDSFSIVRFFNYAGNRVQTGAIDRVVFFDGTVWNRQEINRQLMSGSEEDDYIAPIVSVDGTSLIPAFINAGAGDDQITGTQGGELILGGSGNDLVEGGAGDDIIDGGIGSDVLSGGTGNDIYRFGVDSGVDIITNIGRYFDNSPQSGAIDVLELDAGLTPQSVTLIRSGFNLVIDLGNNNDILFVEHFFGSDSNYGFPVNPIQEIRFSNGVTWDVATITSNVTQTNDALTFGYIADWAGYRIANSAYLISGRSGDLLEGGSNVSTYFNSGAGDDLMAGGVSADRYVFGRNFDRDIILDQGGVDQIGFTEDIDPSEVSINRAGNDLLLSINNFQDYITVRNFFSATSARVESVIFANGIQWDSAYLIANAISVDLQLVGSLANDSLVGSYGNDVLHGGSGNDSLIGAEGNDLLDGGTGADTMIGGRGSDTYIVDNLNDVIVETAIYPNISSEHFESVYRSTDTVRSSVDYTLHEELENLELTGTQGISGAGNWRANVITGNAGSNVISGNGGNDNLLGGAGDDTLYGGEDDDLLDGGVGNDVMNGGGGNDTYIVDSAGDQVADFAFEYIDEGEGGYEDPNTRINNGDDTVNASINYALGQFLENLTLTGNIALSGIGNELDNLMIGNVANNTLTGNEGDDSLTGGLGNDQLLGGIGSDTYLFSRGDGVDLINDASLAGSSDIDVVRFSDSVDSTDISVARDNNDLLLNIRNSTESIRITGYFAVTNSERLNLIERIEFFDGTVWTPADVGARLFNEITGTDANNTLSGTMASDWIRGLAGADTLRGLDGNDLLDGGIGNDRLEGGNGDDRLLGGDGNDNLIGGAGTDTLLGGLGNDVYTIDNIDDVVTEGVDEGTDTVNSSVSYTLTDNVENLTLTGIEALNATGNALANRITGNAGSNMLDGAGGNDTLIGGDSSDTLIGGEGNDNLNGGLAADIMMGGVGNDTYTVDNLADVVTEAAGEGTDMVSASITYTLGENLENLTLTGSEAFSGTGNALDNRITGNAGDNTLVGAEGNDVLNGGLGADTMIGGIGNDSYTIDYLADTITELVGEGTDTVSSSITFTLNDNIENLTLTGTNNIDAIGNALDNRLTGNAADNLLNGADGNDTLSGGVGNDVLLGGAGNDVLNGGVGDDQMSGGAGNDTYTVDSISDAVIEQADEGVDQVNASISFVSTGNIENVTLTGAANINAVGNALANRLTGNAGDNQLNGGDGNDTISGAAGNDELIGGAGDDALSGGTGSNVLLGGSGNDRLSSDAANSAGSIYEGGAGNDSITGGQQNDTYRFNIGDGKDVITDKGLTGMLDTISFGTGITSSMLQFNRVGNNLVIGVNGNVDTITISGWYSNPLNQIEQLTFANGATISGVDLQALTSITLLRTTNAPLSVLSETSLDADIALINVLDETTMPRLQNSPRFSSQALLDQMQTLNDLVRPSYASTVAWVRNRQGIDAILPEVADAGASVTNVDVAASRQANASGLQQDRLRRQFERQSRFERGAFDHRYHEQELDLLIESMSRFTDQNTAVDSIKPTAIDQLQPIVIVPPRI